MKILAYIISLALVYTIGGLIASWVSIIPASINARLLMRRFTFLDSYGTGTIECILLIFLSVWSFSWFNFELPLLYVILLTLLFASNNIYRIKTRSNLNSEFGYFVSQLIGFPGAYFILIKANAVSYSFI